MLRTLVLTALAGLVLEPRPVSIIVTQPLSPVQIVRYRAERSVNRIGDYDVEHTIWFLNRSTKPVTAIQFGLVSFDVFNRFLEKMGGIDVEGRAVGDTAHSTWVQNAYGSFEFLTGVAYVERVRFEDGQIWVADQDAILAEMRKIQSDFDAAELRERRPEPK